MPGVGIWCHQPRSHQCVAQKARRGYASLQTMKRGALQQRSGPLFTSNHEQIITVVRVDSLGSRHKYLAALPCGHDSIGGDVHPVGDVLVKIVKNQQMRQTVSGPFLEMFLVAFPIPPALDLSLSVPRPVEVAGPALTCTPITSPRENPRVSRACTKRSVPKSCEGFSTGPHLILWKLALTRLTPSPDVVS